MATVVDRWDKEPDKRNGMRWQVRWKDEQKRDRRKAFDRKVDADRFRAKIEHDLNVGTYRDPRSGAMLFGDYADIWFASQLQIRPSTQELYEGWISNHLKPAFGRIPMGQLNVTHGRDYLADDSRTVSTRRRTFSMARRILDGAIAEQLIAHNPFTPLRLPKDTPREANFLTLLELEELVARTHPHYKTLVRTAGLLGLRQGELFGLHPDNLDLEGQTVRVVEQLTTTSGKPQRVELKTHSSKRSVAIPMALVEDLHEQLTERSSREFVFTSNQGGPIQKRNFLRRVWEPARISLGRPELRFHDLRHTAATIAIATGAHPKAIQDRLGHSSIQVTLDRYGHLMPGTDADVASGIDDLITRLSIDFGVSKAASELTDIR